MLSPTLGLSNLELEPDNLYFSQISRWCWCFWTRDHLWEPLAYCFCCFYICFLKLFSRLLVTLPWFACLLIDWSISVFAGSFSVFAVLQSSLLGPQFLHIIFWWSHPIDWLEIPTKCWWLSQVLISCQTSSWLMFPLYFLGISTQISRRHLKLCMTETELCVIF